eukprot:4535617-Pyramimonas_sp.AAC.1
MRCALGGGPVCNIWSNSFTAASPDYLPSHPNPTRRPEFQIGGVRVPHVCVSMFPDPPPLEIEGKLKPSGWVGLVWWVVISMCEPDAA